MKKRIAILGSTGSIGTQALDVISANPDVFTVSVLTAGNNADLLIEQAVKFLPSEVVICNANQIDKVKSALASFPIKVHQGEEALVSVVESDDVDIVLTAMVGYSGLLPTIHAIKAGKAIALANKETLVVAGELITALAKEHNVSIYPVDSEHSAIFQCLAGEENNPVEKIILTASGGPFRGKDRAFLAEVTKALALKHPNWTMGAKITIDSATLMNKGLEVIEAKWLFDLQASQIDVIVHPQSIIHSMVQFEDGSIKAQMGLPDMKLPIQYALNYPSRLKSDFSRFNFASYPSLTFEKPDLETFRNLAIAYEVLEKGGNAACIVNAANEIAVDAFLHDRIGFLDISDVITESLAKIAFIGNPSYSDYVETNEATRRFASDMIQVKV
ncbi:1-deoxy-D-xylulose-5-phosphate reductoisomerase [Dyadobacter crusticola]|uniref:1-deoxy-D-xylulose-5-phosphate reductoisomerase n=1 Tax=Dyadobacter crusticola TaxID=292407 RepID=UPI0004E127C9|nr:1-deoxy-D-xylulose-5-phosphate reductoisomerase [Dyadobacter crusticola]